MTAGAGPNDWLEKLKTWQAYPALILAFITPWIQPFLKIQIINSFWRPEIDVATGGVLLVYMLHLLGQRFQTRPKNELQKIFVRSGLFAIACCALCYAIYKYFIHKIDPDWLWLANGVWVAIYVLFFVALLRAVFAGLLSLR